ncbi:MAG: hypothetical protein ACI8RZ_002274 [Myxococcota bacterium]|jgi:hypothetical protein
MSETHTMVSHPGSGSAPLLRTLPADQLADHDLIGDLLAGTLGGILVEGVFAPALAAGVVETLLHAPRDSGPVRAPPFPGISYGAILVLSEPDLVEYHRRGEALLSVLTAAGLPLVEQLSAMLTKLSGGQVVLTPPEAPTPLTIRVFESGDGVGVHSERDDWPSMTGLRRRILGETQLSCYTPLRQTAGGALHLYHRPPPGFAPEIGGMPDDAAAEALARFGFTEIRPAVGDLLIFDGGRYNHRVLPAQQGQRWTAGAFLAQGRDGQRYAWS